MDWPVEVVGSQLAGEWEASVQAFATILALAASLGALAIAVGGVVASSCRAVRLRRFWCPAAGRDVEVRVEEAGVPGFRQTLRVMECSTFEPAAMIACQRGCRDATRRRPGSASPAPAR